ncbi:MAG: ribonuclease P protein component [bacterium]
MLPKGERLRKAKEIRETIHRKQYTARTPLLSLVARDNNFEISRVVAVAKKAIGSAVVRNKSRRKVINMYCKIRHKLAKKVDIVLFLREDLTTKKLNDIENEIMSLIIASGLRK